MALPDKTIKCHIRFIRNLFKLSLKLLTQLFLSQIHPSCVDLILLKKQWAAIAYLGRLISVKNSLEMHLIYSSVYFFCSICFIKEVHIWKLLVYINEFMRDLRANKTIAVRREQQNLDIDNILSPKKEFSIKSHH